MLPNHPAKQQKHHTINYHDYVKTSSQGPPPAPVLLQSSLTRKP